MISLLSHLRILIVISPLMLCSACSHMAKDNWTGKDKAQHFFFSAVLAAAGIAYGEHQHWSQTKSGNFGLLFSISIGVGKELYDSQTNGSGWSWKDFTWDVAGAISGYSLYHTVK